MEIDGQIWSDAIVKKYGVRISADQIYADRGYVYAGSEYVATMGWGSFLPQDAREWSESITSHVLGTSQFVTDHLKEGVNA